MGAKFINTDPNVNYASRSLGSANMGIRMVERLGITNPTIKNACAVLYSRLSEEGIWGKANLTVLPFVGGNADTHKVSMRFENQNLFFANSLASQHTSLGYNPLATAGSYAISDFILPIGMTKFWMAAYNTSVPVSSAGVMASARLNDASNNASLFLQRGNGANTRTLGRYSQYASEISAQTATNYAIKKGMLGFQRESLNRQVLFDDGIPLIVEETTIAQPVIADGQRLGLMAARSNGAYSSPANFSLGFFAAGTVPLTEAEWIKFNNIVVEFQNALGRK